jgi:hypothetical protein
MLSSLKEQIETQIIQNATVDVFFEGTNYSTQGLNEYIVINIRPSSYSKPTLDGICIDNSLQVDVIGYNKTINGAMDLAEATYHGISKLVQSEASVQQVSYDNGMHAISITSIAKELK